MSFSSIVACVLLELHRPLLNGLTMWYRALDKFEITRSFGTCGLFGNRKKYVNWMPRPYVDCVAITFFFQVKISFDRFTAKCVELWTCPFFEYSTRRTRLEPLFSNWTQKTLNLWILQWSTRYFILFSLWRGSICAGYNCCSTHTDCQVSFPFPVRKTHTTARGALKITGQRFTNILW